MHNSLQSKALEAMIQLCIVNFELHLRLDSRWTKKKSGGLVDKLKAWESVSLPSHIYRLSHCPGVVEWQWWGPRKYECTKQAQCSRTRLTVGIHNHAASTIAVPWLHQRICEIHRCQEKALSIAFFINMSPTLPHAHDRGPPETIGLTKLAHNFLLNNWNNE